MSKKYLLDSSPMRHHTMIGERSSKDLSSLEEGSTHIPRQTHTRQENACQMNKMSPDKLPAVMGEGETSLGGEMC